MYAEQNRELSSRTRIGRQSVGDKGRSELVAEVTTDAHLADALCAVVRIWEAVKARVRRAES